MGASANPGGGDVAAGLCENNGLGGGRIVGSLDEIVGVNFRMSEEPADDIRVIAAVVGHFGDGAFADVAITGEAGVTGAVDWRSP